MAVCSFFSHSLTDSLLVIHCILEELDVFNEAFLILSAVPRRAINTALPLQLFGQFLLAQLR